MIATEVEAQVASAVGPTLEIVRPPLAVCSDQSMLLCSRMSARDVGSDVESNDATREKKLRGTLTCGNYAYGLCCAHRQGGVPPSCRMPRFSIPGSNPVLASEHLRAFPKPSPSSPRASSSAPPSSP